MEDRRCPVCHPESNGGFMDFCEKHKEEYEADAMELLKEQLASYREGSLVCSTTTPTQS